MHDDPMASRHERSTASTRHHRDRSRSPRRNSTLTVIGAGPTLVGGCVRDAVLAHTNGDGRGRRTSTSRCTDEASTTFRKLFEASGLRVSTPSASSSACSRSASPQPTSTCRCHAEIRRRVRVTEVRGRSRPPIPRPKLASAPRLHHQFADVGPARRSARRPPRRPRRSPDGCASTYLAGVRGGSRCGSFVPRSSRRGSGSNSHGRRSHWPEVSATASGTASRARVVSGRRSRGKRNNRAGR